MNRSVLAKALLFLACLFFAISAFAAPTVVFSPTSLDFGSHEVNTTTLPVAITMTNEGNATLNISKIVAGGSFAKFTSCGATLAPHASCTISVFFSPETAGSTTGNVVVTDDAPDSPQRVPLKGVGVLPGAGLSPIARDFGTVPVGQSSGSKAIKLTNQGTQALTINGIQTGSSEFTQTSNCPTQLNVGASCSINVTFTPSTGGTRAATLNVSDSDPSSPQQISLTGTGTSGSVSLSPVSLTFGTRNIGSPSNPKNITLTNQGTTTVSILNITASGDFTSTTTCGNTLDSGSSCTITVVFKPWAEGVRPGFITVSDTDPSNLQTATLSGTGTLPPSPVSVTPRKTSVTFKQSQQYQAFLNGSPTSDVSWFVDNVAGGNAQLGTISKGGLYTPPGKFGSHAIKAVNNGDASQFATVRVIVTDFRGMFTYHGDIQRTGQNLNERLLDTGNVNSAQFGKLFSYRVDGRIYTQPLYVSNVQIPSRGSHNVVYVATEHDSVYAFDADGKNSNPLWKVSFIDPGHGIKPVPIQDLQLNTCTSIGPEVGVTGTPVIDPQSGTLYVLARTKERQNEVSTYHQKLHALDITTGAERAGSPVEIEASVPGTGEGSVNGTLAFDPLRENSRVSMLLLNGVVYMAWAAICDYHPYHGWVLGYDASSLAQVSVFNTSPDGQGGGIWESNAGLTADSQNNIYFTTTNGNFDADQGGRNYGDTLLKLNTESGLALTDTFTPYNQESMRKNQLDFSSGGVTTLPDQPTGPAHLLVTAGKEGTVYLVNRDQMGGFHPTDNNQIVQTLVDAIGFSENDQERFFGQPSYFQNQVFYWGNFDSLKSFRLFNGLLSTSPIVTSAPITSDYPGPTATITADGKGGGVLWVSENDGHGPNGSALLRAFDAANISRELYNSAQAGSRDLPGHPVRFQVPTVGNGKVYLGTETEVDVYGLLP
jgi:archaellum component FlaF (FlaF/FlaG flagellin family)